jgi:cell division protein FtsX
VVIGAITVAITLAAAMIMTATISTAITIYNNNDKNT